MATKYQFSFIVPLANLEECKAAIFAAGAGSYPGEGNYTEACWTVLNGIGQFRPGATANPHIGTVGELETLEEARVMTLCVGEDIARAAVAALKKAHPYEEPAYAVVKLEDF
ncbi:structural toxin protein [Ophiostoma piceae UAMH 11346]|uniref:ATP phosphoribosyltransferase n=1 Tax=Ophiostoma piceae (strain UAMH 11346) TaxID=1262450 RepID=S3C227_OPHP1|nr:structural toxin protein [Ophiostoma piceae UAMH 11346]